MLWTSKRGSSQFVIYIARSESHFGAHGEEETPVPIPNTEVKLLSGDYTAQVGN